jgi:hypothetical protein
MSSGLRVLESSERWALGELDRCILVVWRLQPDEPTMRRRAEALRELCARSPAACALVEIVEVSSRPPAELTRRVAMDVFRDLGPKLSLISFTLEGDQLRATVARAIITAMLFFVKQPQPAKVFREIPQMLAWVQRILATDDHDFVSSTRLALETLRQHIVAAEPSFVPNERTP